MTVDQITKEVSRVKPISSRQVRRYLVECKVEPLGSKRFKPLVYPNDSVKRVLDHLGLKAGGRISSLEQLRVERSKARRAA